MEVGIIILCLILSAFFSGMEVAFISSNKIYLEIEKKQDDFTSKILFKITQQPSRFIATMLVGNNLSLVIYGFFMGDLLMKVLGYFSLNLNIFVGILIQIILSTIIILATSEFLPKLFFQIYANPLMKFFALPSYVFYKLLYFPSTFLIGLSDFVSRTIFKSEGGQMNIYFSKMELGNYISEHMNAVQDHETVDSEIQIFQNALEFSGVKARDIMTPRTEITAVNLYSPIVELRELFIQTGYSKILVYKNSLDEIVGYVHSFELFKKPRSIKSIMIPVEFVPETIFIKDIMNLLTKKRKSIAVVLDEYGGTAGILTMEDIVEELFGEIEDEHDLDEKPIEKKLDNATYLFSTQLKVDYLNTTYKLDIPESESYTTLGGYIVNFSKEIPQKGDKINIDNYQFDIEKAANNKIELVKMSVGK